MNSDNGNNHIQNRRRLVHLKINLHKNYVVFGHSLPRFNKQHREGVVTQTAANKANMQKQ